MTCRRARRARCGGRGGPGVGRGPHAGEHRAGPLPPSRAPGARGVARRLAPVRPSGATARGQATTAVAGWGTGPLPARADPLPPRPAGRLPSPSPPPPTRPAAAAGQLPAAEPRRARREDRPGPRAGPPAALFRWARPPASRGVGLVTESVQWVRPGGRLGPPGSARARGSVCGRASLSGYAAPFPRGAAEAGAPRAAGRRTGRPAGGRAGVPRRGPPWSGAAGCLLTVLTVSVATMATMA